jgi:hypothetical protein
MRVMHVLRKGHQLRNATFSSPRSLLFLIIGVFCVLGVVVATVKGYASRSVPSTSQKAAATPKPAATISPSPQTIQPVASSEASGPSTSDASKSEAKPMEALSKPQSGDKSCAVDLDLLQKDYNTEMQKAKGDLDSKLSFIMGQINASLIVDNYNKQLKSIYDRYDSKADAPGCDFELTKPAPLPLTYSGL